MWAMLYHLIQHMDCFFMDTPKDMFTLFMNYIYCVWLVYMLGTGQLFVIKNEEDIFLKLEQLTCIMRLFPCSGYFVLIFLLI